MPRCVGEEAPLAVPQRDVDVARVALALVVLRHERERVPVLVRDLLRTVAVDRVIVRHRERLGVPEVHLVLAEVALALRVLDGHSGTGHSKPYRTQDRLDVGRSEDRVVDVVRVRELEPAVGLGAALLVRLGEQQELELGADHRPPAPLGEPCELGAQDLARRWHDRRAVVPLEIAHAERSPRQPRDTAQRVEVGAQHEVAVPALPRGERVALDRVHVDVDREQVVAALGAVLSRSRREMRDRARACPSGGPACRRTRRSRCRAGTRPPPRPARRASTFRPLAPQPEASSCASIRSSSASEPWRIGPLNQRFAESIHQPPNRMKAPPTVIGA